MRYSHKIGEPIPHSQPPRTAMSRLVKQNLMTHRRDSDPFRSQSAAGMVAPGKVYVNIAHFSISIYLC